MREPPTYISWIITCQSSQDAETLRQWIADRINLDRVIVDQVRSGVSQPHTVQRRLGDYFDDIRAIRGLQEISAGLRLIFYRRSGADPFWKDLMVGILQEVDSAPQKISIALDAKCEREPVASPLTIP